jgi:hypothetical protein
MPVGKSPLIYRNHFLAASLRSPECPAEENANCGKLRPINARKSSEKIDTRINRVPDSRPIFVVMR